MSSMLPSEGTAPNGVPPPTFDDDHDRDVLAERVALHIESLVPQGRARCLDIACGDVMLAEEIRVRTARAEWCCVDVLDVDRLPYADGEFDVALLCDVLHDEHDAAAARLLAEIGRVAQCVLVKDRFEDGPYSRIMPHGKAFLGNADPGVASPGRGYTREAFVRLAADRRLRITALDSDFDLGEDGPMAGTLLRRDFQFIAVLRSA